MDYLTTISSQLGISLWLFIIIIVWSAVWKLLALWKSARQGSVVWFIVLAVFNTVGILPILYIFVFSKMKCCKSNKAKPGKKAVKKKIAKKK